MNSSVEAVFLSATNLEKPCVQVYDAVSGAPIRAFRGTSVSPNSLCIIGSNEVLCGQKDKPHLQAWSVNQIESKQIRCPLPHKINVMTVSRSGNKLCALGVQGNIYIYDMNTGSRLASISNKHYQDVTCLKFTSCGNYLASAGADSLVYLWSIFKIIESRHEFNNSQIEPFCKLGEHTDKVTALCISGVGTRGILITSSLDHSVKVFDLSTLQLRYNLIGSCPLTCCEVNSIGSQVFLAGVNGRTWGINLLPCSTSKNIQIEEKGTQCHDSAIHHLALTSCGTSILTGSANGEVKLWSINMQESKNNFSNPSLALQRSLFVGKGAITNLVVKKMNLESFNSSDMQYSKIPAQFCAETNDDSSSSSVAFSFKLIEEKFQREEHIRLAAELLSMNNKVDSSKKKELKCGKKGKGNKKKFEERAEVDNQVDIDELSKMDLITLKKSNKNLYDFIIKHLLE